MLLDTSQWDTIALLSVCHGMGKQPWRTSSPLREGSQGEITVMSELRKAWNDLTLPSELPTIQYHSEYHFWTAYYMALLSSGSLLHSVFRRETCLLLDGSAYFCLVLICHLWFWPAVVSFIHFLQLYGKQMADLKIQLPQIVPSPVGEG